MIEFDQERRLDLVKKEDIPSSCAQRGRGGEGNATGKVRIELIAGDER